MVALSGSRVPEPERSLFVAPASPSFRFPQLEIIFRPQPAFEKLLAEQQNPQSPLYQHAFSHQEVLDAFGPTSSQVSDIVAWLTSQGFQIISADRDSIRFKGTVAEAQQAFGVSIMTTADGHYYGNINDPKVPTRFATVIGDVVGFDSLVGVGPGPVMAKLRHG